MKSRVCVSESILERLFKLHPVHVSTRVTLHFKIIQQHSLYKLISLLIKFQLYFSLIKEMKGCRLVGGLQRDCQNRFREDRSRGEENGVGQVHKHVYG